jgi:hypothetical protein
MNKVTFDSFRNSFFDFADPFIKKYCIKVSPDLESSSHYEMQWFDPNFDEFGFRMSFIDDITNSSEFANFLYSLGVKDNKFELFERHFEVSTKKEFGNLLSAFMMACNGKYPWYQSQKRQSSMIQLISEVFHLLVQTDHRLLIDVAIRDELIVERRQFNLDSHAEIVVSDSKNNLSTLTFKIRGKNNSHQIDPMKIVNMFMGSLLILKGKVSYASPRVHYLCGCRNFVQEEQSLEQIYGLDLHPETGQVLKKSYLSSYEIIELQKFFDKLKDRNTNQIHFALSKYIESNSRKSSVDVILDIVITLEILLGKADGTDSIKYRLCNRLMNCLSRDKQIREDLYKRVSKLYDVRSGIVHGSTNKNKHKKDFQSCARNTDYYKEILRSIFKVFLGWVNMGLNHEEIVRRLDYNIAEIDEVDISSVKWYD